MINEQLLAYVRAQRAAGVSKDAIIAALAQGGWTSQDVNEAFAAIEGVRIVQPPPMQPPVQSMPGAQPMQTSVSPLPATQPIIVRTPNALPVQPKKKRRGTFIMFLLFLIVLAGAGVWLYLNPQLLSAIPGSERIFGSLEPEATLETDTTPQEPIRIVPTISTTTNSTSDVSATTTTDEE